MAAPAPQCSSSKLVQLSRRSLTGSMNYWWSLLPNNPGLKRYGFIVVSLESTLHIVFSLSVQPSGSILLDSKANSYHLAVRTESS
jgi:hypothetical protein